MMPGHAGIGAPGQAWMRWRAFRFGFPTATRLHDGTFLATHWSVEDGRCGIRWTKLRVDW